MPSKKKTLHDSNYIRFIHTLSQIFKPKPYPRLGQKKETNKPFFQVMIGFKTLPALLLPVIFSILLPVLAVHPLIGEEPIVDLWSMNNIVTRDDDTDTTQYTDGISFYTVSPNCSLVDPTNPTDPANFVFQYHFSEIREGKCLSTRYNNTKTSESEPTGDGTNGEDIYSIWYENGLIMMQQMGCSQQLLLFAFPCFKCACGSIYLGGVTLFPQGDCMEFRTSVKSFMFFCYDGQGLPLEV